MHWSVSHIIPVCLVITLTHSETGLTQLLGSDPPGFEGQVILEGGTVPGTGNVLIFHDNRWGKVCDDGWDLQAAQVICRNLGFPRALTETRESYFGEPEYEFWLDDIRCYGEETSIADCERASWGEHNCRNSEAAGVFCAPQSDSLRQDLANPFTRYTTKPSTPISTTTIATSTSLPTTSAPKSKKERRRRKKKRRKDANVKDDVNEMQSDDTAIERLQRDAAGHHPVHDPGNYDLRVVNGRNTEEGLIEVQVGGSWGVICSDHWTLTEAMVVCRQTGLGYGKSAVQVDYFGGGQQDKLLGGIRCEGEEGRLSECYHEHVQDVVCSNTNMVAGVICARGLPDLVPNATLLQESTYLQDRPMFYLQCAMEENCASDSAFTVRDTYRDWHLYRRRLLRFSSSTWNFGTDDFRPSSTKNDWEWHLCHMHYHSMSVFAHYDILDSHHNRIAEGHKASFCLEDVQCIPDKEKKFQCKGFGDQGISVGCADDYLHDIDCQWIDVTDVPPGNYIFKVHVNPEQLVAELDFNNNAVTCNLAYTGYNVTVSDCQLGPG